MKRPKENGPQQTARPTAISVIPWQEAEALQVHEVADWFPKMSGSALKGFKADIDEQSQGQPVLIWRNKEDKLEILDGRHRRDVAVEFKRKLKCELFEGIEEEACAEIISRNLHRRHLTTKQRAEIANKLTALLAKQNLSQNCDKIGKRKGGRPSSGITQAQQQAAGLMNVSVRSVQTKRREAGQSLSRQEKRKKPNASFADDVCHRYTLMFNGNAMMRVLAKWHRTRQDAEQVLRDFICGEKEGAA